MSRSVSLRRTLCVGSLVPVAILGLAACGSDPGATASVGGGGGASTSQGGGGSSAAAPTSGPCRYLSSSDVAAIAVATLGAPKASTEGDHSSCEYTGTGLRGAVDVTLTVYPAARAAAILKGGGAAYTVETQAVLGTENGFYQVTAGGQGTDVLWAVKGSSSYALSFTEGGLSEQQIQSTELSILNAAIRNT